MVKFFGRGNGAGKERGGISEPVTAFKSPGLVRDHTLVDPDSSLVAYYAHGTELEPGVLRAQLERQFSVKRDDGSLVVDIARVDSVLGKIDASLKRQ